MAPSPSDVVENPNPLNAPLSYPLPVLPFPGQQLVTVGDLYALPGDQASVPNAVRPMNYEPGNH